MGSTSPLVALDVRPPQQEDLLGKYAQLQSLKNQQIQTQMAQQEQPLRVQALQQQVQSGGVQLQQQQQALKDQQAKTQAMQDWDGKDINNLYPLILKHGGSSDAVMSLKSSVVEQQQKAAVAFKDMADGGKAKVETLKQNNDLLNGALSPLTDPAQVPDAQLPQAFDATVQRLTAQGILDPQGAQAAQQLKQSGDPNAIRQGLTQFIKSHQALTDITTQAQKQAETLKAQTDTQAKQAEISYYQKNGGAPGVPGETVERNAWMQAHPGASAADYVGAKAGMEAAAHLPYEMALAKQRQALSQGDPNTAAQLLVNGDATLSELKARGATPEFIANTLNAAHKLSNGQYNAQSADAQFSVAKSPANVAFFGSAKSLIDKGGTLDQLADAAKKIPGGQIPAFNSVADWEKAASGSGPIAKYASLALGVADDYSKVMGGGQGSDASRQQALALVGARQSPEQRAASIDGIRGAVGSQTNSRIGNNPVLGRMYGTPSASPSGAAPAPQTHAFSLSAWQKANPQGDPNAAAAAAKVAGYQVTQ